MTPRYPGHDPDASVQQLRWQPFETRFDAPDRGRVLPPSAHRLATPPPDEKLPPYASAPAPLRGATRLGLATACGPNAATKAVRAQTTAVPVRSHKPAPKRQDKATCPHDQGWHGNGKGTSAGKKREQCRACGLNRSVAAE